MYRIAIEELLKWKESKRRKPLIIEGARQVGKTWLMKEFAIKSNSMECNPTDAFKCLRLYHSVTKNALFAGET